MLWMSTLHSFTFTPAIAHSKLLGSSQSLLFNMNVDYQELIAYLDLINRPVNVWLVSCLGAIYDSASSGLLSIIPQFCQGTRGIKLCNWLYLHVCLKRDVKISFKPYVNFNYACLCWLLFVSEDVYLPFQ